MRPNRGSTVQGVRLQWLCLASVLTVTGSNSHSLSSASIEDLTKVGPLRLNDTMVVTEWAEKEAIGVRHTGLVTGEGRFTLAPAGTDRTEFCWTEELQFPWWMGGILGDIVGARILELVWRRNLKTLRAQFA